HRRALCQAASRPGDQQARLLRLSRHSRHQERAGPGIASGGCGQPAPHLSTVSSRRDCRNLYRLVDEPLRGKPGQVSAGVLREPVLLDSDPCDDWRSRLVYRRRYLAPGPQPRSCQTASRRGIVPMASIVQTQTRARVRAYTRFSVLQRLQHLVLIVSFTVLAVTGLPQKFAGAQWAESMIGWMGGIESVRVLHHYAAIVLILLCITELLEWGYKIYVERARWSMVPRLQDVRDAFHHFIYNL